MLFPVTPTLSSYSPLPAISRKRSDVCQTTKIWRIMLSNVCIEYSTHILNTDWTCWISIVHVEYSTRTECSTYELNIQYTCWLNVQCTRRIFIACTEYLMYALNVQFKHWIFTELNFQFMYWIFNCVWFKPGSKLPLISSMPTVTITAPPMVYDLH